MSITSAPILVTGVTGFIGAEIAKQLLERGYSVRGTTRNVNKARADGHLSALPGAPERLELVSADLLNPNDLDRALEGCEYVMHVASPYIVAVDDPEAELLRPAVEGTLSVLRAASKAGSRRVVLTSSVVAVNGFPPTDTVFAEDDWNGISTLDDGPYFYSKTMAERAAWRFMESERPGFDLVAILPSGVIGPSVVPHLNQSHQFIVAHTNGAMPAIVDWRFNWVDVRDVADAHFRAMETPAASGRYLCAAGSMPNRTIVDLLKANGFHERYRLPSLPMDRGFGTSLARLLAFTETKTSRRQIRAGLGHSYEYDTSRIQSELGVSFRPVNETMLDALHDLERWGHLGRKTVVGGVSRRSIGASP